MSKIMVTGVGGFVGNHLVRELHKRDCTIIGVGFDAQPAPEIQNLISDYVSCDLTNVTQVESLPLEGVKTVINLAGLAVVRESFDNPDRYKEVNVKVLSIPGEHILKANPDCRVIAVSTGTVYGSDQPMPLTEESAIIEDGSPYAVSKILMEKAAITLRGKGLNCIIVRPFNHIGPGQAPGLLIPDLYAKLVGAAKTDNVIQVGNLQTKRDYTDVRDIVRAYADLALAEKLDYELYNVCRGESKSGKEILDIFLKHMGLEGKISTEVDPAFIRPNDQMDLYGSYARLHQETGWEPTIPIDQTIQDFIKASEAAH
jgi:GDP-4-dehydro-6-deoxy-D-mannose reductase